MAVTEIASLDTVKAYLRIPTGNTIDDAQLQTVFMPAAQAAIEREVGPVVARNVSERHDGGRVTLHLRVVPVLYIVNVQESWGFWNWELDDQEVAQIPAPSIWAYSLDHAAQGEISRRMVGSTTRPFFPGLNNILVDYVAGRETVPQAVNLAFLELVAHWYRASQLRTANQASAGFNVEALDDNFSRTSGLEASNFGVPMEIIEMLKADKRRPFIA